MNLIQKLLAMYLCFVILEMVFCDKNLKPTSGFSLIAENVSNFDFSEVKANRFRGFNSSSYYYFYRMKLRLVKSKTN